MSTKLKVDELEAWLRAHGTPAEIALFNRSVVQGFFAVAGGQAVTAAHIATSVGLARDAGIDVAKIEELGALVVKFATPAAATIEEFAPPIEEVVAPVEEVAAPVAKIAAPIVAAPAPSESAPLVVSFRGNEAIVDPAPSPSPSPSPPRRARTSPPAPSRSSSSPPRSRRTAIVAAAGAVLVVGISVVVTLRSRGDSSSADAPAPTHVEHLPHVALDAQFPAGWHVVAADPHSTDAAAPTSAIVVRGGTATDPDQAVFVATVPLADELAVGAEITNAALVRAARHAERGTAARVTVDGGSYKSSGCAVSALGAHIAVCRGTAKQGAHAIAVQTFVRIGEDRAVVALFVGKPTAGDTAREAEQIVGSLGL